MPQTRPGLRRTASALPGLLLALLAAAFPAQALSATDICPNAAVRAQQGASGLPDCRAYELVNPSTVDVGEVNRAPAISDDGNQVAYQSVLPGDDALGGAITSTDVARRSASGWTSIDANIKSRGALYANTMTTAPLAFSADFTHELVSTNAPAVANDINNQDGYRINVGLGTATLMNPVVDNQPTQFFGGTANLDRVFFLVASTTSVAPGLYSSDGNTVEQLSFFPNGAPIPEPVLPAGHAGQRGFGVGDTRTGDPWVERRGVHAVSDDGSRVFMAQVVSGSGGVRLRDFLLYMRDTSTTPAETVPVSASQRTGDIGTLHHGDFIAAAHDGSTAYFATSDQLTNDAQPGGGIYKFDLATRSLILLTSDPHDTTGLNMPGAMASDDQSHIYFTSTSALDGAAQAGDTNAYVWTNAGGVHFIAKVNGSNRFTRVTPDGRYALIASSASINGAPSNNHTVLYEYDDLTKQVVCVSCRPDGTPSQGDTNLDDQSFGYPGGLISHPRNLTFDGRVFFATTDEMVTDDQTPAADVYEYDKGTVSMLTAGRGDSSSYIADNSDDGSNVFIVTRTALVGADIDAREFDLYDVRTDGGFLAPPPPTDPCKGDDCQGPPPAVPGALPSGSSRVSGAGNAPSAKVVKLSMSKLSSAQRSRLARTGSVGLSVRVSGGGTLSIRGRGRLAGKVKTLVSARTAVLKRAATTVPITIKLSSVARRELSRRSHLKFTLELRLSGLSKAVTSSVNLTRAHR